MPIQTIGPAGSGISQDVQSPLLPKAAWTDALNMRFLDGSAWQFYGQGEVYGGPPIVPLHVVPVNIGSVRYWLYAGTSKIYGVSSSTGAVVHTNLTRQTSGADVDYAGAPNQWTNAVLSGIPILNPGNLVDPPQRWDLDVTHRFQALDNWPAGTYCKALRPYENQLVALNVTKPAGNLPFMVKWSTEADPGKVPSTWDETDPAHDAGEVDLAQGGDHVIDGGQLGSTFMVYKEQSTYRMDYAGGAFVENFTKVLGQSGSMNTNCWVELDGFHAVFTGSDIITHNGQSATSVLDKKMRRSLFSRIDSQAQGLCFTFKNPWMNEAFFCFPEAGSSVCNLALVWNFVDGTCTFRELPNLNHANYGPVEDGLSQPWDGDDAPWSSDITSWNAAEFSPATARVMMGSADQKLFLMDSSTTFDGVIPNAYLERRNLPVGDVSTMKLITGIRPLIQGNAGETVMVSVGGANDPYTDPVYGDPVPFVIGETIACDLMVESRYPAVRFANGSAYQWRMDSYGVDWEPGGAW